MKTCRKCNESLPLSEYYKHPKMADGHLNFCKRCVRERVVTHRELNIERIRKYDRGRGHHGKFKTPDYKKRANTAAVRAKNKGLIKSAPCVICGTTKTEMHHPNYRRPLEIIHLCVVHHRRLHAGRFSLLPAREAFAS